MNRKKRNDKLAFIFETGRAMRFYMDHAVDLTNAEADALCGDLSPVQMKAAMEVWLHQPLSLGRLASLVKVTPPAASAIVDKLVEKEVLTREPDPEDRRRVVLRTHPRAEAMFNAFNREFRAAFDSVADRVGDQNVAKWYEVMLEIREILEGVSSHE